MAPNSSPLPLRHLHSVPRTPSLARNAINIDDDDDELGDTIPCSPAAFLRDRDTTQPTQLLPRPSLLDVRSSSPASVVEVPASSPFQPNSKKPTLGSRLAPQGTIFRPPPRQPPPAMAKKRPATDSINLISDDEDDLTPPRGDIRPTTFKKQIAAYAYAPEEDDAMVKQRLRQLFDIFGERYPSDMVKAALKKNACDLEDSISWLEKRNPDYDPRRQTAPKPNGRRLVTKGSLAQAKSSKPTPQPVSLDSPSPSPPKKQPKRRLIQGLKRPSSPSPTKQAPPPSSDDPLIIDLVDNDREDAYKADKSPEPHSVDDHDRLLTCINTSSLKELAAMTGMKESLLEPMIEKRPFANLAQAQRVSGNKKPGARKSTRISIGETAVSAIEVFLNAASAIDEVVAKCEIKAQAVNSTVETWDMDSFGHMKRSARASPTDDGELPPTPTSISGSKLTQLVIPEQPRLMNGHCKMKPFQLFGLNWMSVLYNLDIGCILADEMGLGKTCQVISLMCHLAEKYEANPRGDQPWPNLVVVPPSTYNNWLAEFEKFAPELSVMGYRGSQGERAEIAYEVANNLDDYHVVLATYSQINCDTDIEAMESFNLNAAIFDEGHKMKNPETKVYKDLRRIPSAWKMLLTGTPVQNNLLEMTSLLNFINPKMFDGYMNHIQYIFSHKVTIRDVSNGAFLYSERVKRARTILEPFILQRRKDQVLSDMPLKICSVVQCDMTPAQKAAYDEYEALFKLEPALRAKETRGRQNDLNNVWMQLRKAALHPLLFRRHFADAKVAKMAKILMDNIPQSELHQPDIKHLIQELKNSSDFELHLWCRDYDRLLGQYDIPAEEELNSGKVLKLLELVAQYQKNGDRVLVFSKFSRLIELLQEVLALRGIEHRVLMGATNVSERQNLIDEFNRDETIPVFLLTTGAGGTGINLTAANKVIIFDQSDNPQDDIQAENRAHRLGQTRDVEIIRLVAKQTIEELIYKACQKKIELANKVTGAVLEDEEDASGNLENEVRKMMESQMTPP